MGRSQQTTPDMGDSMTIVHGKWTERVPEGTDGAQPRVLTKGKNQGSTVYELGWPTLENLSLVKGEIVQPEGFTSKQVEMLCKDYKTGEMFNLSLPADSKYLKQFIMCIPMLNTDLPFNLELHQAKGMTPSGDPKFNLRVVQAGRSVPQTHFMEWKKDAQGKNIVIYHNGCPAPEQKQSGKWDFDDQDYFLCSYLAKFLDEYEAPTAPCPVAEEPVRKPASQTNAPQTGPVAANDVPADFDEYEEDIPF